MSVAELTRNGTAVAMPVKTIDIALDEMGWPGWVVTMRTDPPSSVYDALLAFDEQGQWWAAFGKVVLAWNLTDEDGHALPLPKDTESEDYLQLRVGVMNYVFTRYLEGVKEAAVPKGRSSGLLTTSSTNGESPSSG